MTDDEKTMTSDDAQDGVPYDVQDILLRLRRTGIRVSVGRAWTGEVAPSRAGARSCLSGPPRKSVST